MEIIQAKIEDLKPSEYNPRGMTEKEKKDLTESILRFGMVEPIIVNSAENRKKYYCRRASKILYLQRIGVERNTHGLCEYIGHRQRERIKFKA